MERRDEVTGAWVDEVGLAEQISRLSNVNKSKVSKTKGSGLVKKLT